MGQMWGEGVGQGGVIGGLLIQPHVAQRSRK